MKLDIKLDNRDNFYYIINRDFDDNCVSVEYLCFLTFDEIYSTKYFISKIQELNGCKGFMDISFETKINAQIMIDWIESLIIMKKLTE